MENDNRVNPQRNNIFEISPQIIDASIKRWLRKFDWCKERNPKFIYGEQNVSTNRT